MAPSSHHHADEDKNEKDLLYDAVAQKDASQIAHYFQHKRSPSLGLYVPLYASSTVADEFGTTHFTTSTTPNLVTITRDLQVVLMSPTSYELPWKSINQICCCFRHYHLPARYTSDGTSDQNDTTELVASVQTFLQQVAAEWKGHTFSHRRTSLGSTEMEETQDTPRIWLDRIVQEILSSSHALWGIGSTILSLAKVRDEALYQQWIDQVLRAIAPAGGVGVDGDENQQEGRTRLVAWLYLLQPYVSDLDVPQWILLVQNLYTALSLSMRQGIQPTDALVLLRHVLNLHRIACGEASTPTPAMQEDRIWHGMIFHLYQRACATESSSGDFIKLHRGLESSLVSVPNCVLIKWLRWTFQAKMDHRTIPITMAFAIYKAWCSKGFVQTSQETNMGPILWEQLSTFLFSELKGDEAGHKGGADAIEFVFRVTDGCHYKGQGTISCTQKSDVEWLIDVAAFLWESFCIIELDARSQKVLFELCFEMMGTYFEATSGFDLILFVLLIPMLYEQAPNIQRLILARMRRCFSRKDEQEDMLRLLCVSLRLMAGVKPYGIDIWRCLSSVLRQDISSKVSAGVVHALMGNSKVEHEISCLCEEWITRPLPSCLRRGRDLEGAHGFYERGLKILSILLVRGSVQTRMDSLCLVGSFLDGSKSMPLVFREQLYECVSGILHDSAIDTFAIETLFRHASRGLFRIWGCYKEQMAVSDVTDQSTTCLQEAISVARLLTRVLSAAKKHSSSDILVESMWPYETFTDALFAALLEWHCLRNDSSLGLAPDSRFLDVSNNDPYVASAIASLSSVYQIIFDADCDMELLDVKGASTVEMTKELDSKVIESADTPPLLQCSISKDSIVQYAWLDLVELSLSEGLWKDKPSDQYKPYVLALSSLITSSKCKTEMQSPLIKPDVMLTVLDRPLLSEVLHDLPTQKMTGEQIDSILALVLFICKQIRSLDVARTMDELTLQRIILLYEFFCSEERVTEMLVHLEGGLGKFGNDTFVGHVLDMTGREQLDASVRKFRTKVLKSVSSFFEVLAAGPTFTYASCRREDVRALLLALLKDFKMGLQCSSGGIDTDLCVSFIDCIEMVHNNLGTNDPYWISKLCVEMLERIEGILQAINLNNADVVDSILSLSANSLPAIVNNAFKEYCIKNASDMQGSRADIGSICDDLFEMCLEYNQKRLSPLEELQASNRSKLVCAPAKSTKASGVLSLLPSLVSLFESDKTWNWVFKAILESYRDAFYYAARESRTPFNATESHLVFAKYYFGEMEKIGGNVLRIFGPSQGQKSRNQTSSFVAVTLPSSVKDCLCELLQQFCETLLESLRMFTEALNAESTISVGCMEALCILVAWLSFDEDICLLVKMWYKWEERTASRAGAKQSVVVTDVSFIKDLAKIVEQVDEIAEQLGSLGELLSTVVEKSVFNDQRTLWGETKALVKDICGESFNFQERLERRVKILRGKTTVKVNRPVPDKAAAPPIKRKKRKSPSEPAACHRSQLVEDWLEKDKGTGDCKMGDDTFADLEDFLVED
eukprot:scaffold1007_cov176-Amphora_coffeaeformis.AAC.10